MGARFFGLRPRIREVSAGHLLGCHQRFFGVDPGSPMILRRTRILSRYAGLGPLQAGAPRSCTSYADRGEESGSIPSHPSLPS
jgi:hypothetical protein